MPEAAEVKTQVNLIRFAAGFDSTGALEREEGANQVAEAKVVSGRYLRSPLKRDLVNTVNLHLKQVLCKGKCIFFEFVDTEGMLPPLWAINTLGLTGSWSLSSVANKHVRFYLTFRSGHSINFCDQRNFGTFKLTFRSEVEKKLKELGEEPLVWAFNNSSVLHQSSSALSAVPEKFLDSVKQLGKSRTVAEVMLDQAIFCGVGNYVRADACYLAGINPTRGIETLSETELRTLFLQCARVTFAAYHNVHVSDIDQRSYAGTRMFENVCYQQKRSIHDSQIVSYKDPTGRTMWWCPSHQS